MRKKSLLLGLAAIMCVPFAMVGCSSDDSKDDGNTATVAQAEAKKENSIIGYWKYMVTEQMFVYYAITEDSMETVSLGDVETTKIKVTDKAIENVDTEEAFEYTIKDDVLTLNAGDNVLEMMRITEKEYEEAKATLTGDGDDAEDDSINGISVEPGVEMTVTEDDGTIVVYANDGDGTYIKSKTKPTDDTDDTDETEESSDNSSSSDKKNGDDAFSKNPYLADITLPMDLSDLHDKLGDPTTEDEQWDTWKTSDDYKITAYHKDGSVWKIEANPAKSSAWAEDDIDFSGVDTAKSYTYDELAKEVGSTGTVYSLTNVNEQEKYSVIWYNNSGDSMVAEFDAKTDTAIVITK